MARSRSTNGKTRHLEAGQILRADGILLNPDGSVMPVFDHIAMSNGRVMRSLTILSGLSLYFRSSECPWFW